jgi:hypothetical protein
LTRFEGRQLLLETFVGISLGVVPLAGRSQR